MASIADILHVSAGQYPDKVAVRYRGRAFTYSALKDRVDRLAAALRDLGVGTHDHVALISPNSNVGLELLFAAAQVGAVLEQYNIRLSPSIIGELLGKSEARIVFVSDRVFQEASELEALVGHPLRVFFVESEGIGERDTYEELIASAEPLETRLEIDGKDAAILLYTSGTTGTPRGVLLSHDAILHQVLIDTKICGLNDEAIQLCVLPLFHVTFLSALEAIYAGAELVILDGCKGKDLAGAIRDFGITHVSLIPFLLRDLTTYVEESGIVLDTLQLILYGAEPISIDLLERAKRAFGCAFVQGYGMTETTAAITMLLPEDHDSERHLASAGKPLPGVEIRTVGKDGVETQAMDAGEIIVKTKTIMLGYYKDPLKTGQVMQDGWYHTGDIGYFDEEGFLYLVARKDDMVISGGENIYPHEISLCIEEMDGVADVATAGILDKHWGETLATVVVRKEGSDITEADIIEHCAQQLGRYKKPRRVFFIDKIERNPSGKVSRRELKTLLESLLNKE